MEYKQETEYKIRENFLLYFVGRYDSNVKEINNQTTPLVRFQSVPLFQFYCRD